MADHNDDASDLMPTGLVKTGGISDPHALVNLDAEDESLAKWKASLGLSPGQAALSSDSGPKVSVLSLSLNSASLAAGAITLDLTDPTHLSTLKKNPVTIKEGVDYCVGIKFKVNHGLVTGLRYIHVVKRAGVKVDRLEEMLGSYAPSKDGTPFAKNFAEEESPSGMLARSGTYNVRSRVIDDEKEVYADFEWSFKLGKEW